MTKKDLCELTLRAYGATNLKMSIPVKLEDIPKDEVYKSSRVAIAMEYLGLLPEDLARYAMSREGTLAISHDENGETSILSFRNILDSLPKE